MIDLINFINNIKKERKITINNLKIQLLIGFLFTIFTGILLSDANINKIFVFGITFIIFFTSILLNIMTIFKIVFFSKKYNLLLNFYNTVIYVKKQKNLTIEEKINILSEDGIIFNQKADFYKLRPLYLQDIFALLNVQTFSNQQGTYNNNNSYNKEEEQIKEALEYIFKSKNIPKEMMNIKEITKQYRIRAKELHPDKPTGSKEEFQILNNYFQLLKTKLN